MQRGISRKGKNTAYTPHIQEKDMNMRKIMAGLAVTTLVIGSASLALARGHHGGHYGGMMNGYAGNCGACYYTGGYQNLTPEKRAAVDKLIQEHAAAMNPLREQLQAKRLELDALSRNPNAQPESISKLAGEVAKLSSRLRDTGAEFRGKMAQEMGVEAMPGAMGGYGYGGMMGRGHMGGHMNGGYHHMGWNR